MHFSSKASSSRLAPANRPDPSHKADSKKQKAAPRPLTKRVSARESVLSLDQKFLSDPLAVSRYCGKIFAYTLSIEKNYAVPSKFLTNQPEISRLVRAYMVDTIVRWVFFHKFKQETLFLAVYILDRYLSLKLLNRKALQAVCLTVLFIASKFEEVKMIQIKQFMKTLAAPIEKTVIFEIERDILLLLDFRLTYISPFDFLKRIYHVVAMSVERYPVSCYLLETFLYDESSSCFPASEKAVAAFLLTAKLQKTHVNIERIKKYVDFNEKNVTEIQRKMLINNSFLEANNLDSLKAKYKDNEFLEMKLKNEYYQVKNL